MTRRFTFALASALAVALTACLATAVVRAGDHCKLGDRCPAVHHMKTKCPICGGGTGVYSGSSYACPLGRWLVHEWKVGDERAGNPRSICCLARPSEGPCDGGYYVGGGCAHPRKADLRYCNEGTWGWDYMGHCLIPIVDLGYWHGRRDQSGNYKTEGPKIFHHE